MNDPLLSLLGIARRAGKLSCGHDAVIESIVQNKAQLCLCCTDASPRLQKELRHACTYQGKAVDCFVIPYEMNRLSNAIGTKAAVVTVDDAGFAKKLCTLLHERNTTGKDDRNAKR